LFTLREEHRLRVYGSKREDVTAGWRTLHCEEVHDLFFSSPFHLFLLRVCDILAY